MTWLYNFLVNAHAACMSYDNVYRTDDNSTDRLICFAAAYLHEIQNKKGISIKFVETINRSTQNGVRDKR
jgi:hypothetical protein